MAGSYSRYMFNFVRNCQFSKVTVPYYIPISSVWEFCFLPIVANTSYGQFLNFCHSSRYLLSKICISLITNDVEHLFIFLWNMFYTNIFFSLLVNCSNIFFIFHLGFLSSNYWDMRAPYISWICPLLDMFYKYFPLVCG